jgi:hypothetical protein
VRISGNPADFGAPAPDDDILIAGLSLCQDYLAQVRQGSIVCRPGIAATDGRTVTFTDGSVESADVIICATGYDLDIPYLPPEVWSTIGPAFGMYHRTLHPDLPGFAMVGQFPLQGPYFPLLELQARWIIGVWSGQLPAPSVAAMRAGIGEPPPVVDSHHVLALTLAEQAGVAPDLPSHPDLQEALLFGPMLPVRYRLDGPGALPDAAEKLRVQTTSSPWPLVVRAVRGVG